jgi:hypothetical protein
VDQHVGTGKSSETASVGAVSPVYAIVRPGRAGPTSSEELDAPVLERDRLALLEHAALRAGRDTERVGAGVVEPARPLRLDERVSDRRNAVGDGKAQT